MKPKNLVKTQARSLASRQAVIDAVIELISNQGFSSTNTANIAKQAGVSWGVLQYHFGGKREIFQAVHNAMFLQHELSYKAQRKILSEAVLASLLHA